MQQGNIRIAIVINGFKLSKSLNSIEVQFNKFVYRFRNFRLFVHYVDNQNQKVIELKFSLNKHFLCHICHISIFFPGQRSFTLQGFKPTLIVVELLYSKRFQLHDWYLCGPQIFYAFGVALPTLPTLSHKFYFLKFLLQSRPHQLNSAYTSGRGHLYFDTTRQSLYSI